MTSPGIIVHSLDHALAAAEAAAELDVPLVLASAAGGAGATGIGWFAGLRKILRERCPGLSVTFVIDCADEAGTAMAALRRDFRHIRFSGSPDAAAKLVTIGLVLETDKRPSLDLLGSRDPGATCRKFLAGDATAR